MVELRYSATFLTSALDGSEWSALCQSHFNPHPHHTHCTGGWVGSRARVEAVVKRKKSLSLPGIKPWLSSLYFSKYTDWGTLALL